MRLRILAISDTHLGEDTSLLSFPHGRRHLWHTLDKHFQQFISHGKIEVEEMILLGDIPDRTLSSTSQIITHTNAFIQMLGSKAHIGKGVYIPGNHDHTLWTNYRRAQYGRDNRDCITGPYGELIVEKGKRIDEDESGTELLSIFFGYPEGSSWRQIQQDEEFDFVIANPIYVKEKVNDRTYVFTHGTHFKKIVTLPRWIKRFFDYLQFDKFFGGIEIDSDCDVSKADSLRKLEQITAPFVDSLWPSSRNDPSTKSDQLWYLLTKVSGKFGKERPIPKETKLFSQSELPTVPDTRIKRLTVGDSPNHDSLEQWQKYFCLHMLNYLDGCGIAREKLRFIYGDTHDGGWGEMPSGAEGSIRIYNCGGWVVNSRKEHPACHLFAVDDNGEEYMLDVSFGDVKVEQDLLLELAATDAENRPQPSLILDILLRLWSA